MEPRSFDRTFPNIRTSVITMERFKKWLATQGARALVPLLVLVIVPLLDQSVLGGQLLDLLLPELCALS